MSRVAIVTDSVASLPPGVAAELGIHIIPLMLAIDGTEYLDGVDIRPGEVYRRLRQGGSLPTTSTPRVGDIVAVFENAATSADAIASIHVPSTLSATLAAAQEAAKRVKDVPIRAFSTASAAMGQGFAAMEAARLAAAGADLDRVVERAMEVGDKAGLILVVETLEYLRRGGRIGGAAALLGSLLNMKPIVTVVAGRVQAFGRARSKAKAIDIMLDYAADQTGRKPLHVAIFHADVADEAEALGSRVMSRFDCVEVLVTEFTPVMGAHTGPGVLGLAFFAD